MEKKYEATPLPVSPEAVKVTAAQLAGRLVRREVQGVYKLFMRHAEFRAWVITEPKTKTGEMLDGDNMTLSFEGSQLTITPSRVWLGAHEPNWRIDALMQSTGLLDKNGRKIFEGDIVRKENRYRPVVYTVGWEDRTAEFWPVSGDEEGNSFKLWEVIGHVWQEPKK